MEQDNPCKPCSRENEFVLAKNWCCDCEEHLCVDCAKAHKKNRLSQSHSIVKDSIVSELPEGLVSSYQQCPEHKKFNLDVICTNHDQLCCRLCMVRNHRNCAVVLPVESASDIVLESKLTDKLVAEVQQIETTIGNIIEYGKENVKMVETQDSDISKAIGSIRNTFLTKLDQVEQKLLDKLKRNIECSEKSVIKYQEAIQLQKGAAIVYQQEIDFIRNHASENKAFLLIERLKADLKRDKKTMIKTSKNVENIAVTLKDSSSFSVKSLGKNLLKNQNCPINYTPSSQVLSERIEYTDQTNHEAEQTIQESDTCETVYEELEDMRNFRPVEPSYVKAAGPYLTLSKTELKFNYMIDATSVKKRQIWQGTFRQSIPVVIKLIKNTEFSVDIQRLLDARADNIIKFYGGFVDKNQNGLVFELMPNGNLTSYLQTEDGMKLHQTEFLSVAAQIARGMSFLESKNIVHTKLQGNKILIGENGEVKVSGIEYGTVEKAITKFPFESKNEDELSFDKDEMILVIDKPEDNWWEGELHGTRGFFPVNYVSTPQTFVKVLDENLFQWYALETLQSGRCDLRSNVWSFGIIMIELFEHGATPYRDVDTKNLLSKLKQDYRPPKPSACPDTLYKIMQQCWSENPEKRPTFKNMYHAIEDLLYDF